MAYEEATALGRYIKSVLDEEKKRDSVLEDAKKTVQERGQHYGKVEDSFALIGKYWSAYLGKEITPEDVGMMMILLKVARQKNQHKRDNLVDIAGYAECVGRIVG